MLFEELLETLKRPNKENQARHYRPPYDLKMLLNLAVINLYPPFTTDQAFMFLSFLFPSIIEQKVSSFRLSCYSSVKTKFIWYLLVINLLFFISIIRLVPPGRVDNNVGQDRLAGTKALDPLQTTNPLIARALFWSPNCAWYWVEPFLGPRHYPYS